MHFDDTWLTWALLCSIAIFFTLILSASLLLFFASKDVAEARQNRKRTQLALDDLERELRRKLNGHQHE